MKRPGDVSANRKERKSLYERSLSLVFSFWCLLFLFYSRFGHGNRDSYLGVNPANNHRWVETPLESNLSTDSSNGNNFTSPIHKPVNPSPRPVREKDIPPETIRNSPAKTEREARVLQETSTGKPEERNAAEEASRPDESRSNETAAQGKGKHGQSSLGNIIHRLEAGGAEYNYASAEKGAKVLAHNREAKGASHVLSRDRDRYLRNPCSADGKFVVVELSEETLVDAVEIANLEHYSSNPKDFGLWGSPSYPAEAWTPLGSFVVDNAKHPQRFALPEPRWARYLRLDLVSHYGSEFYCTLSYVEVYGVDAMERMLEDLIVVSSDEPATTEQADASRTESVPSEKNAVVDLPVVDKNEQRSEASASSHVLYPLKEVRQQSSGRVPSDAVLKILMQKLRSLELNLSVLEEYARELNRRHGDALPDMEKEISRNALLLEETKSDVEDLMQWRETVEEVYNEFRSWESTVSPLLDALVSENAFLRKDVEKVLSSREALERKELAVLAVSLSFSCVALFRLLLHRILMLFRGRGSEEMYRTSRGWLLILLSSSMTTVIAFLYD